MCVCVHLRAVEHDLRRVVRHPLGPLHVWVGRERLLHVLPDRVAHAPLQVPHPDLHGLLEGDLIPIVIYNSLELYYISNISY